MARLDFKKTSCFSSSQELCHFFAETLIFVQNSPKPNVQSDTIFNTFDTSYSKCIVNNIKQKNKNSLRSEKIG